MLPVLLTPTTTTTPTNPDKMVSAWKTPNPKILLPPPPPVVVAATPPKTTKDHVAKPPTPKDNIHSPSSPFVDPSSIPAALTDLNFCLKWALDINLTLKKAETIITSFNMIQTTRDRLSRISHHILKSFFLWFLNKKNPAKYLAEAKKEINTAGTLLEEWDKETKKQSHSSASSHYFGYVVEYIDGVDYVITAMKTLIDPQENAMNFDVILYTTPTKLMTAGILHVKQEFFRPFFDEIDHRVGILGEIRLLNPSDSRACLYLAKTLGQKRKMENFISAPGQKEMDLLAEGHLKAKGDHSIVIELCFCLAQYLRNTKDVKKRFPLLLYRNSMVFKDEAAVSGFINGRTSDVWKEAPDAAPLYVKLAEIHSSLLPDHLRHPTITPLALVNRALEKYKKYSKALHRKAKILFKTPSLSHSEEGLKCLEASFACGETNCDALCDLVFRLLRFPSNREKLENNIFKKYCTDYGENLWGRRKVGTLFYLYGCHLWMLGMKREAVEQWMKAEVRNPNPTFYFQKLHMQKTNYKWHQSTCSLSYEEILKFLKTVKTNVDVDTRDVLICKLRSLLEQ